VYLYDDEFAEIERVFADELGQSMPQALRALARGDWVPVRK
jgi:hypothetical protein